MRIICNKCGRKMNMGELLPYVLEYLTKMLAPEPDVPIVKKWHAGILILK